MAATLDRIPISRPAGGALIHSQSEPLVPTVGRVRGATGTTPRTTPGTTPGTKSPLPSGLDRRGPSGTEGGGGSAAAEVCGTIAGAQPALPALPALPAFEDVFDWHEAEIYRFALRLTGNRPDADDLFQETMLKAFRAFGRLQPNSNHRAWLYRIASNTFLSGRRKFDRVDSLDLLGEHLNFEVAVAEDDHAAGLDARGLLREIAEFVEHLPPKQRIALVLRKFHGLGYDDVAAALGCTEGAARTNVHQALRKLREAFEDRL